MQIAIPYVAAAKTKQYVFRFLHINYTDAILEKTNRVARRVLRPLGYKMLQVVGLNPATVDPITARAALEADLTPQQQAAVDAEAERLFKQVSYLCGGVLLDIAFLLKLKCGRIGPRKLLK